MSKEILRMENVTKEYNNFYALRNVSIKLEKGKIYGLIGQNGAGKTTLMRIICGFASMTNGKMSLFGYEKANKIVEERRRIGCMIEYPGLITNLTAMENMRYHRMLRGIPNVEVEKELLELVGLGNTQGKKAGDFSLGMRQRLGIAIALLGNPELLVLDEPINGLDPIGVVEIRELIKKLCEEHNMTILISSHNLPELYQTATDYIIIHKGELIQELTQEELESKCSRYIKIQCTDTEKLLTVLETKLNTKNYIVLADKTVRLYDYIEDTEAVAKAIFQAGMYPLCFTSEGVTLENYFISVINGRDDKCGTQSVAHLEGGEQHD